MAADPELLKVKGWYRNLLRDHDKLLIRYSLMHKHMTAAFCTGSVNDEWLRHAETLLRKVHVTQGEDDA